VSLERLDTPLLRRALLAAVVGLHLLFVLAPADVLAPVDPWRIGRMIWQGQIPYRDFPLEYPPGAVLAFLLPGAVPHALAEPVLALQAVAAELAVIFLVLRKVDGALWRWLPLSLLVFPFLSGGFDALPMAAIAISTALLAAGRPSGWWVAGAGTLIKLSPAAAWAWSRTAWRTALAALALTAVALLGPTALADHPDDSWFGYTLHRGVQVESLAATTTWVGHRLTGEPSEFAYRFKSFELDGAEGAAKAWLAIGAVGILLVALRATRAPKIDPWLAAFTTVVCLLLSSKVLSPQFIAWPAPLVAVLGGRWFQAWLAIAAVSLFAYLGTGATWILTVSTMRNVGLVAVAALGLRALWGGEMPPSTE
jgi:hypothetical protein